MNVSSLTAISPLEGRYIEKMEALRPIFSEYGLIKNRLLVEIRWLETLIDQGKLPEIGSLSSEARKILNNMVANFSEQDALRIKQIESVTNHDVKAVEYFIKKKFEAMNLGFLKEFIHFGLTSA